MFGLLLLVILVMVFIFFLLVCGSNDIENFTEYGGFSYSDKLSVSEIKNLKLGQKKMTQMFKQFDRICRKYGLKYWCTGGTLIGAMRHQGWVPWDGDIDLAMLEEDYLKLEKLIQGELPSDMWFQSSKTDKHYRSKIAKIRDLSSCYIESKSKWHNGLQLDIFVFKQVGNKIIGPGETHAISKDDGTYNYQEIFPLKELPFEDFRVYVTNNYIKNSIKKFGSYPPKLPDKSKRYPHEGKIDPIKGCSYHQQLYPNLCR